MNRDQLIKHLEKRYTSKRGMLSRIPLSIQPDPLWHDLLNMRRSRGIILPLNSYNGASYWFVTTDKMIAASEKVIETLYENETEFDPYTDLLPISTLEEIYYTSYVEGSQLSIQAAIGLVFPKVLLGNKASPPHFHRLPFTQDKASCSKYRHLARGFAVNSRVHIQVPCLV